MPSLKPSSLDDGLPRNPNLCVLKFGSSVLQKPDDYARAAHEIYRHTRRGEKVIAVVSALEGETDALFGVGEQVGNGAADHMVARLVRTGELKSAALMGLALERAGVPASVLDPHEMGLIAEGKALDANLARLDAHKVLAHLEQADVIVAPGFFGDTDQGPATLGRGGTDLTAVMFAHWLGASRARLIKDVDGVYSGDPHVEPDARRLDCLDYSEACRVSHGLVQEKAIIAAQQLEMIVEVAAPGKAYASRIGPPGQKTRPAPKIGGRKQRIAVLGHGAVGAGVCRHVLAHPEQFELNPVLVRNTDSHSAPGIRFATDPADALGGNPDIVVETIGGTNLARTLCQSALRDGAHLVTANKAVIALDFNRLHELARQGQRHLRYSAAVGGSVPILEHIHRYGGSPGILSIEGVMNGTCNFIFDRLADGDSLEDAILLAQEAGFAEADPSADIDGHDAADKLAIIIRHAFGVNMHPADIATESLRDIEPDTVRKARNAGRFYKQVAQCSVGRDGSISAKVEIRALPDGNGFAALRGAENAFELRLPQGLISISGQGAGRWPTAEAVFADVMNIQRHSLPGGSPHWQESAMHAAALTPEQEH